MEMRGFIIHNSCDWSGAAGWPGREGYPGGGRPSGRAAIAIAAPAGLHGPPQPRSSSSPTVRVTAPWPSPTGCRGFSAPTTKPWGTSKCGPQSPACDQVCWQQNWAGRTELHQAAAPWPSAVLHRYGLCLPTCSPHRDSGEGFLFHRRLEQCHNQHHLCPADRSCALILLTAGDRCFPLASVQHTHSSGCHTRRVSFLLYLKCKPSCFLVPLLD